MLSQIALACTIISKQAALASISQAPLSLFHRPALFSASKRRIIVNLGIGSPISQRLISSSSKSQHENPLGLPMNNARPAPPTIPRRAAGPPQKSRIRGVKHVVVVASGKGGVGKSTVAVSLALSLLSTSPSSLNRPARIGLLDLDIFGPSVPKLMGLENTGEPELSQENKLVPLQNHGIKTMSMGYLLPPSPANDSPVVWRGLMVQKAVQQLLFDVDWTESRSNTGQGDLDVLVIDMPPGTGDVQLSLGQLVLVDGAIIVSTPQDVALIDARKGVGMFNKVSIPIIGLLLNMSHYTCSTCTTAHEIFGSGQKFGNTAQELGLKVLGKVPLVPSVSDGGDAGRPILVQTGKEGDTVRETMKSVAQGVWEWLIARPHQNVGTRG